MADLLSEAIADAKRVKSAAIANAKLTLEEAFQPTLQRMISTKLAEEEGEGMDDDDIDVNINFGSDDDDDSEDSGPIGMGSFDDEEEPVDDEEEPVEDEEPEEDESDMELESLIRELEGDDMDLEEASTLFPGMDEEDDMMGEGEDDWSDPIPDAIAEGDDMDFDEDELTEAIQSLVEEEMEAEMEDELSELFEMDGEFDLEDDLSESELETMTVDAMDEGDDMDFDENELEEAINEILGEDETVDVNIDEEYSDEDEMMESNLRFENRKLKGKLTEAYRAVTTMKNTLNEVNLLNAKLMYTTKTFQQFELNENQKHRVLDAFDRANSVREVKLVYTTICESRSKANKPTRITEGFASKSQNFINSKKNGTETRSNIVEGTVVKWNPERLQQLAGMRKLDD